MLPHQTQCSALLKRWVASHDAYNCGAHSPTHPYTDTTTHIQNTNAGTASSPNSSRTPCAGLHASHSPQQASLLTTCPLAPCAQVEPLLSCVQASTRTSSNYWDAGNPTPCSATYASKPTRTQVASPNACSNMAPTPSRPKRALAATSQHKLRLP